MNAGQKKKRADQKEQEKNRWGWGQAKAEASPGKAGTASPGKETDPGKLGSEPEKPGTSTV